MSKTKTKINGTRKGLHSKKTIKINPAPRLGAVKKTKSRLISTNVYALVKDEKISYGKIVELIESPSKKQYNLKELVANTKFKAENGNVYQIIKPCKKLSLVYCKE